MKISEMNQAEFEMFGMISEKLGISPVSTEEMREAIGEMRKVLDQQQKAIEKELKDKARYLNEIEKMVSGLEKNKYKGK